MLLSATKFVVIHNNNDQKIRWQQRVNNAKFYFNDS